MQLVDADGAGSASWKLTDRYLYGEAREPAERDRRSSGAVQQDTRVLDLRSPLMRDLDELFAALQRSTFRARFALTAKDRTYIARRTLPTVLRQCRMFIDQRLAPQHPPNDGRQTPMRGHPGFVAQHATATCCRKCLARWHHIPAGQPLTSGQIDYVMAVIERWLLAQLVPLPERAPRQLELFPSEEPSQDHMAAGKHRVSRTNDE